MSLRSSFTFVFALNVFIFDLIMTLSQHRKVVAKLLLLLLNGFKVLNVKLMSKPLLLRVFKNWKREKSKSKQSSSEMADPRWLTGLTSFLLTRNFYYSRQIRMHYTPNKVVEYPLAANTWRRAQRNHPADRKMNRLDMSLTTIVS